MSAGSSCAAFIRGLRDDTTFKPFGALELGRKSWPAGSVGCVVERNKKHLLLTAAHLFVDHGTTNVSGNTVIAFQPAVAADANAFGTVERAYFGDHEEHGHIDAALVFKRARNRRYTLETGRAECPRFTGVASPALWASPNVGKIGAATGFRRAAFSGSHGQIEVGGYPAVNVLEYRVPPDAPDGYQFAIEGDSGAVVFTLAPTPGRVIGILFGVSNDGRRAFVVPLQRMLDFFDVELSVPHP